MTRSRPAILAVVGLALAGCIAHSDEGITESGEQASLRVDWASGEVVLMGLPTETLERATAWPPDDPRWHDLFSVRTDAAALHPDLPPVAGRYKVMNGKVAWRPRLGWAEGATYSVRYATRPGRRNNVDAEERIIVPTHPREPPRVTRISPRLDVVPANLLRFYVEFSQPMRARAPHHHVRLIDDRGEVVESAFVEHPEGLWDPDQKRLTMILHPGRIKRGVGPNVTLGLALDEGRSYSLVVAATFEALNGSPLGEAVVATFQVAAADRDALTPLDWQLTRPSAPDGHLIIDPEEAIDLELLPRNLVVLNRASRPVEGHFETTPSDVTAFRFIANEPWAPGPYHLAVSSSLEDLAGNTWLRVFDRPTAEPRTLASGDGWTRVAFEVLPTTSKVAQHENQGRSVTR